MPKQRPSAVSSLPLNAVLGTQAKIRALRCLWRSGSIPLSCTAIAERSAMVYRSIDIAIGDLMAAGVVELVGGRHERLFRLNAEHRLAAPLTALLRAEGDHFTALRAELSAICRLDAAGLVSASIVGSAVSATDRIGEDVHLVVVVDDAEAVRRWADRFVAAGKGMLSRYGVRLMVTPYSRDAAIKLWGRRTKAAENLVAGAMTIAGIPLMQAIAETGS